MALTPEGIKVLLLFTLLVTMFILSVIPVFLNRYIHKSGASRQKRKRVKTALSLLSCFAAGVFLSTCLLDLFPDAQEKLGTALEREKIFTGYPLTEFVVVFGFLVIFLIEQIILSRKEAISGSEIDPLMFHESVDSLSQSYGSTANGSNAPLLRHSRNSGPILYQTIPADAPSDPAQSDNEWEEIDPENEDFLNDEDKEPYVDPGSHSVIRSIILLMALSLHSIFEGLAIGLQPTTDSVLAIFLPVALHKGILAFALGLNLAQSKLGVWAVIRSDVLFAITSPIGIAIGIIIVKFAPDSGFTDLMNGIIQAVACGTFLFVVFFEILPHEFMGGRRYASRLLKTLLLVLGFATVSLLLFLDPDDIAPSHVDPSSR